MRVHRLVVLIVLVAVGATACGSSSKGAASNSTSTTAASPAAGSSGSIGTTTTGKLSGDSGSSFCDLARSDETAFKSNNITTNTPADLKKLYENIGPKLAEAESKAPSAIKGDFHTFVTAFAQVVKALSDANYDFKKVSPTAFASLGTPAIKAASDHIDQYFAQVCHITTPST